MRKYEVIVTFDPDVNEEGVTAQLEKLRALVESFEGKVISEENSGRQPLAYPMNKKTIGTYVLMIIEAKPEFVAEFTRQMRINDTVLRFMAVLRDEVTGETIKRAEERPARPGGREGGRDFGGRDGGRDGGRERFPRGRGRDMDDDDSDDSSSASFN